MPSYVAFKGGPCYCWTISQYKVNADAEVTDTISGVFITAPLATGQVSIFEAVSGSSMTLVNSW